MSKSNNNLGDHTISRYVLEVPNGVYPLNGDDPTLVSHSNNISSFNVNSRKEYIYPDFNRWVYHVEQDTIMQNYLQKGYFDSPSVSNELLSARSAVHQFLHNEDKPLNPAMPQTKNCSKLNTLSDSVVKAIKYRRKCNQASMKSTYKPPPRVTLTEQKKEMWLKNLANPEIPLSRLSRTIPHGIRNKALLEQCCSKKIPISRALWFVKCVGTNELRGLKRKNGPVMVNAASNNKMFELNWIHDWTVQVTEYIEKLIRDCFTVENRNAWKQNLDYIVKFTAHLYMSELINQEVFLSWVVRFLKRICNDDKIETDNTGDFKLIAIHLIFLKLFWFKLIKIDYLSKELSETLLMIIYKLQEGKSLTKNLNTQLSKSFKFLILYLFYYNSSSFIMSNHWTILKPVLKRIIDLNDPLIAQQFELITYRNESLLMNLPDSDLNLSSESVLIKKLDNFKKKPDIEELSAYIFEESSDERILENFQFKNNWKTNLKILWNWCLSSYRKNKPQQVNLTVSIISSYLKRCLNKGSKSSAKKAKQDIESFILELIYSVNDRYTNLMYLGEKMLSIDVDKFLVLVNKLYILKVFTVSSYLRRLISSGIIYLPNAQSKTMLHILIIQNLPILNNAQCLTILKSLIGETNYQLKLETNFTKSKDLLIICLNNIYDKNLNEIENNSEIWTQLQGFNYGNKCLAVDFFLREFKANVNESSKLVTLNNAKISFVLKIFTILESKARFFQDFLEFVLVNESRTINYYPETLYFISDIVMKNITLVQSLVIHDQQSFSTLLKLIIASFNSLKEQHDVHDFTNFWKFSRSHTDDSVLQSELSSLLSSGKTSILDGEMDVVENNLKNIGFLITVDQFLNADRLRANELKLLEKYLSIIKMELNGGEGEEEDHNLQPILIQLLLMLKQINNEEFVDHVIEFCNTSILPSLYLDFDSYLKFTMRLIVYELIEISELVEIFSKESSISDNITGNSNHRLIWHFLLDNKSDFGLSTYETVKFQLIRDEYRELHVGRLLDFIRLGIIDSQTSFSITTSPGNTSSAIENQFSVHSEDHLPTPVSNNLVTPLPMMGGVATTPSINESVPGGRNAFIGIFEEQISKTFNDVAFTNVQLLIDNIVSKLNKDVILEIFNALVLLDQRAILSSKDLNRLIDVVNTFNLPLCQIILKLVWENELGPDKSEEFKSVAIQDNLMSMLMKFLKKKKGEKDFTQLFNLLDAPLKLLVLDSCKSFFLRSEHFPQVYITSSDESLISYLNEIINNCSRAMEFPGDDAIPLNDSLVFSLNAALEKLIYATERFSIEKEDDDDDEIIQDSREDLILSINLILKIVLIHKQFLVEMILKRSNDVSNDSFIQNLSRLYKSKIVRTDSKLKNYFYDSLLSIELLFTETMALELLNKQQQQDTVTTTTTTIPSNIFKLPPLNTENVLSPYLAKLKFKDGLIDFQQTRKLFLFNEKEDAYQEFTARPFDLIEEANPGSAVNNTSISLQLFNASTERKNPP